MGPAPFVRAHLPGPGFPFAEWGFAGSVEGVQGQGAVEAGSSARRRPMIASPALSGNPSSVPSGLPVLPSTAPRSNQVPDDFRGVEAVEKVLAELAAHGRDDPVDAPVADGGNDQLVAGGHRRDDGQVDKLRERVAHPDFVAAVADPDRRAFTEVEEQVELGQEVADVPAAHVVVAAVRGHPGPFDGNDHRRPDLGQRRLHDRHGRLPAQDGDFQGPEIAGKHLGNRRRAAEYRFVPQAFQDAVERDRADGAVRLEAAADRKPGADEDSAPVLKQQLPARVQYPAGTAPRMRSIPRVPWERMMSSIWSKNGPIGARGYSISG